ncbi:MAG: DUF2332 family protein [Silicimonas sp.]|nr:DUF2332 family protein [Silicimonas sp.]
MSIREIFNDQARHCDGLGSPFMARLMALVAERLQPGDPVANRIFDWPGNAATNADNVPLRLAGALHALKLRKKALTAVYPPHDPDDDTLWAAVHHAMTDHAASILAWLESPPQTNEVRRAAAILPALALLRQTTDLPVDLLELGTSGGLNLRADRFHLNLKGHHVGDMASPVTLTPDWQGPMPPRTLPRILRRAGVDLAPVDPLSPEGELRLLAYLWADQPDRIARTKAAIAVARETPAAISAGDAGEWLDCQLRQPRPDRLRVVFHTVAWQYFPAETRQRALAAMENAVGPLARIAMENDGGKGAAVTLTTWPGGAHRHLGRADFHGRWIEWHPQQ